MSADPRIWHIVTGEYPPDLGGVSDYTAAVAAALAAAGNLVHVWTAGKTGVISRDAVHLHRVLGGFTAADLASVVDLEPGGPGARLLVQWVPHAFGRRGVNFQVPLWLLRLGARWPGAIDVMMHEPFLPFRGSAGQHAAAVAQRAMTGLVVRSAARVFVGTPAWANLCARIAGRSTFTWTPIPSGVPVTASAEDASQYREDHDLDECQLIGVFGRAGIFREDAIRAMAAALSDRTDVRILLIGAGSDAAAANLASAHPAAARHVRATGNLDHAALSAVLRACDLMYQPYPDGVCARHSSASALLAHGRPIVTNHGRFTEAVWAESGAVRLMPSDDPCCLASAARSLLDDPAARERLSAAAVNLYRTRFDIRHTVAALQG